MVRCLPTHFGVPWSNAEVVDQREPMTCANRPGFMGTVGIERSERQFRRLYAAELHDNFATMVANDKLAARPFRRQ